MTISGKCLDRRQKIPSFWVIFNDELASSGQRIRTRLGGFGGNGATSGKRYWFG